MRAIKTVISKTYIGDVGGTMGTGCFSVMLELSVTFFIVLILVGLAFLMGRW